MTSAFEREKINALVKELDLTLNSALYDIGFLQATIGNELVAEKIGNSFSGHALDVAIRAVIQKTLLFVTRSWDDNSDSIPIIVGKLEGWGTTLEEDRKDRKPDFPDDFLEIGQVEHNIQELKKDAEGFQNSEQFLAAKLHRDENVAHLLKGKSGHRRKLKKLEIKVDPVTYDQVIELGKQTADFVTRILQIWEFTLKDSNQWIENSKKHTRLFWKTLPILSEAENGEQ